MNDTPTGRILAILKRLAEGKSNHHSYFAWAHAFGVKGHVNAQRLYILLSGFRELEQQIEFARDRGLRSSLPSDLVNGPLDSLKEAISQTLSNLGASWETVSGNFVQQITPITYLSGLDQVSDGESLSEDAAAEIVAAIAALSEALAQPSLSPAMKAFLEQQIRALINLLMMNGIGGGRAFSDAVIRGLADLKDYKAPAEPMPEATQEAVKRGWRAAVGAAARNADTGLSLLLNLKTVLTDLPKALPYLE